MVGRNFVVSVPLCWERETIQKSEAERASLVVLLKFCSAFPPLLLEDHENLGLSAVRKESWC
jgi:hypothetical protein